MEAVKEKSAPQEMQLGGRDSERIVVFCTPTFENTDETEVFLAFSCESLATWCGTHKCLTRWL